MHRTTASESLLLRSPKASEGQGGALGEAEATRRGNTVGVRDQVMDLVASQGVKVSREERNLLPTTRAQNGEDRNNKIYARDAKQPQNLENALAVTLMPTPTTRDHKDGTAEHERDGVVQTDTVARAVFNSGEVRLPTPTASDWKGANHSGSGLASSRGMATVAEQTNWGKFEPAIRRWEQTLGRSAPAPTKPDGKDGNHRLSSAFTEWMMGLPGGWITDVGLSRNDELKACGNGVVPQQAELALRALLEGITLPRGGGK